MGWCFASPIVVGIGNPFQQPLCGGTVWGPSPKTALKAQTGGGGDISQSPHRMYNGGWVSSPSPYAGGGEWGTFPKTFWRGQMGVDPFLHPYGG